MSNYKLSPSASGRFLTCTASIQHNTGVSENEITLRGSLQHEVAYLVLRQELFGENHQDKIDQLQNPENTYVGREREDVFVRWQKEFNPTVSNYVDYIKSLKSQYNPVEIFLEYKVKMKFHDVNINGTIDCAMLLENGDLIIVDLKTGRSRVETEDNNQMLMYAYGMIQDIYAKTNKAPNNIIISICQSLIFNTQAISYTLKQIFDWYVEKAKPMEEIKTGNLVYRPTKDACKFCQFKHKCNERIKKGVIV
jgi:RecB family exonuclease